LASLEHAIQACDQGLAVEGLGENADGTGLGSFALAAFFREGGDENDRPVPARGDEVSLQVDAAHAGHPDVGDQAGRVCKTGGMQEGFRRVKAMGRKTMQADQLGRCNTYRLVVIDD
jgi:hypothetical protein